MERDLTVGKASTARRDGLVGALLVGFVVFVSLWLVTIPYRRIYLPRVDDITALADALLLSPHARWEHWFTEGHSYFFDAYPEWPWGLSPFARPAFQFLIYLTHFVFDDDWASPTTNPESGRLGS